MNYKYASFDSINSISEPLNAVGDKIPESNDCELNNVKHDYDKYIVNRLEIAARQSLSECQTRVLQDDLDNNKRFDTGTENNLKPQSKKIISPQLSSGLLVPNAYYVELQEFDGKVLDINVDEGIFTAELTSKQKPEEILRAEFDVDDVDKGDRGLFKQGALFIWKVGKEENNGTQQKISQIVFRRLPSWWAKDIKRVEKIGKSRAAAIRKLTGQDTSFGQ